MDASYTDFLFDVFRYYLVDGYFILSAAQQVEEQYRHRLIFSLLNTTILSNVNLTTSIAVFKYCLCHYISTTSVNTCTLDLYRQIALLSMLLLTILIETLASTHFSFSFRKKNFFRGQLFLSVFDFQVYFSCFF